MANYLVDKYPFGDVERPVTRTAMLDRLRRFTRHTNVRIRERDAGEPSSEWSAWMPALKAMAVVGWRTFSRPPGYRIFVQRKSDQQQTRVWKLEPVKSPPDLGCAPELERIHWYLWNKYPNRIRSGGRGYCRFVAGSTSVSRHGYEAQDWFGAAEDIFVTDPNTMLFLEEVAADLLAQYRAGTFQARDLIVAQKRWRAPAWREEHYGGVFHRHIHTDVPGGEPCEPDPRQL